jgi:hypothetical protein
MRTSIFAGAAAILLTFTSYGQTTFDQVESSFDDEQ